MDSSTLTLGFVPGDRPAFSTEWALNMRDRCEAALKNISNVRLVLPNPEFTSKGLVSNLDQAVKVAEQFNSVQVNRLLLGTMNFGDEEALCEVARQVEPVAGESDDADPKQYRAHGAQ